MLRGRPGRSATLRLISRTGPDGSGIPSLKSGSPRRYWSRWQSRRHGCTRCGCSGSSSDRNHSAKSKQVSRGPPARMSMVPMARREEGTLEEGPRRNGAGLVIEGWPAPRTPGIKGAQTRPMRAADWSRPSDVGSREAALESRRVAGSELEGCARRRASPARSACNAEARVRTGVRNRRTADDGARARSASARPRAGQATAGVKPSPRSGTGAAAPRPPPALKLPRPPRCSFRDGRPSAA